jgi:glucan biosynthesis protein C
MNNSVRYHGLDALRAFAMIMGVVIHSSMFYVKGIGEGLGYELTGRIMIPTSDTLGVIFFFIHTWRMPVFFLLAGFFARLMIQKRGVISLSKNRFLRIVVPLAVCALVYNLVFQFGSIQELHHLWFLRDLVWMYALIIFIKWVRMPVSGRVWKGSVTGKLDRIFASGASIWWMMIWLIPATVIGRPLFFNLINPNNGSPGPFFVLGFSYFLIGWFMHRNPGILSILSSRWKIYVSLGLIVFGTLMLILTRLEKIDTADSGLEDGLFWILGIALSSLSMFLIIMGFIGASEAMFRKSNSFISYFVDASYWIYLLHLVVVFAIGAAILESTNLHPLIGVSVNISLTTVICVVTYHICVRYTPVGWVLHGRKGMFTDLFIPLVGKSIPQTNTSGHDSGSNKRE